MPGPEREGPARPMLSQRRPRQQAGAVRGALRAVHPGILTTHSELSAAIVLTPRGKNGSHLHKATQRVSGGAGRPALAV